MGVRPSASTVSATSGRLGERCGLVGIFSPQYSRHFDAALLAAAGVQHRGLNGVGLALQTKQGFISHKGDGLLKDAVPSELAAKLNRPALWTIIHTRYGTSGGYSRTNIQPSVALSKSGEKVFVAHNGEFVVTSEMIASSGAKFQGNISDTPIFTRMLAKATPKTWEDKILETLSKVKGAYSLLIGVKDKLFALRDPFGIRPLIIGRINHSWLVASETHAFDKVGGKVIREIKNGEVVRLDKQGLTVIKHASPNSYHFCDFEWAYFARPNSLFATHSGSDPDQPSQWLSVEAFRERCGRILAAETPVKNAGFVVGIPDSGIPLALGYANELSLPIRQAIIRDHHDPHGGQRLFMRDDQMAKIRQRVLGKLSIVPDRRIWKNAIVVVADDSIIRGNVSRQLTKAIFTQGAKEVHWIVGFPPVCHPCHLGVSMRTGQELIASYLKGDQQKVARAIGATSVNYISPQGFIQARTLKGGVKRPKNAAAIFLENSGCGGCITGLYPVSPFGEYYRDYQEKRRLIPLRAALLISGAGTTALSVIRAFRAKRLTAVKPVLVVSSKPDAPGLVKAQKLGIKTAVVEPKGHVSPEDFGKELLALLHDENIEVISQNGWMPLTPESVINRFRGRIINQHPGPLDPGRGQDFGGQGMFGARVICARIAFAWIVGKDFWTEATTHHVTRIYDEGDIIRTPRFYLKPKAQTLSFSELSKSPGDLIRATRAAQKELLALEYQNVIATLEMFSYQDSLPGYKRKVPLISQKFYPALVQAKQLAVKLFPKG